MGGMDILNKMLSEDPEGMDPAEMQRLVEDMIVDNLRERQTENFMALYDEEHRSQNISNAFREQNPMHSKEAEEAGDWNLDSSVLTLTGEDVHFVIRALLFFRGETALFRAERSTELYRQSVKIHEIATEVKDGKRETVSVIDQINDMALPMA